MADGGLGLGAGLLMIGEAASDHGQERVLFQFLGAGGKLDLVRVLQRHAQVASRGKAPGGMDLEAAEDDLLQPGGAVRAEPPGRHGIPPEPPLEPGEPLGIPEGSYPGEEEVHQDAQGELVAAGILPVPQHLLWRHVRGGAVGQPELLAHEVRQLIVMG